MMHRSRFGGVAALALVVSVATACASMNVSSYVERGIEMNRYRTYNWGPVDTFSTGDPRLDNNPFFQERVQAAVERQLTAKGFEKSTSGEPDLLLHYHASVAQRIDICDVDRIYGPGAAGDCQYDPYEAGTLIVDFVDARTNTVAWRGWAEGSLEGMIDNQDWMEQRIDEAVRRILERLPRRI